MPRKRLKIAISGASGSGKTTLARMLAQHFGTDFIPEGMEAIYAAKKRFNEAKRASVSEQEMTDRLHAWMAAFFQWCADREKTYAAAEGFVADRWEADLLSTWLRVFTRYEPGEGTRRLLAHMKERASALDAVVLLPVSDWNVEHRNEAGLKRRQDPSLRIMASALTHGLAAQCEPPRRIVIPDRPMSIEERVRWVEDSLAEAGLAPPAAGQQNL